MYDKFDDLYNNLSLIASEYKIFTILYAEDDDVLREQVLSILNEIFGKDNVVSAMDGEQALKKYQEYKPNLIILDIQMPIYSGLDVVREIKNMKQIDESSIAIFTAFNEFKYISRGLELNIDGYILKPLNQEQFLELLLKMTKSVLNVYLTNKYQSMLEEANLQISRQYQELEVLSIELQEKIDKLEKEKRYSSTKNAIIVNEALTKPIINDSFDPSWFRPSAREEKEAIKLSSLFLLDDKYEEMEEVINDLDSIIPTVCKDKSFAITTYSSLLKKIYSILSTIYNEVIVNMVKIIDELIENMTINQEVLENKKDKSIITYLESIPRDLIEWLNVINKYGIYSKQEIIQSDMLVMALRQVSTFTIQEEFDLDDFFF